MATRTREKETTKDGPQPAWCIGNSSDSGSGLAVADDAPPESRSHPLASVLGSFRDDLASRDAIMAGVEEYRQRMEADDATH